MTHEEFTPEEHDDPGTDRGHRRGGRHAGPGGHDRRELHREMHALRSAMRDEMRERFERGDFRADGRGPRGGGRGRGRGRRGDIRSVLLVLLQDGPAHGYELIQAAAERSDGMWKPSPGSVYPTLQLLEEEGLLTTTEVDGKRVCSLTDEGRAEAERLSADAATTMPWEREDSAGHGDLHKALATLALAVKQVSSVGTADQIGRASTVLQTARKSIYALLAED